ncbi:MAG: hypothetical protein AB7I38_02985 [Dehalococcoidia bacterium]
MLRRLIRWILIALAAAAAWRFLASRLSRGASGLPYDELNPYLAPGPGAWTPPFPDRQGTYEEYDIVVPAGRVPELPPNAPCPGALVIYASWAELVSSGDGYEGPGAGLNPVAATASAIAHATAARVPCPDGCTRRVEEIWRGWACDNRPLTAYAAVEVKLTCELTV